MQTSLLLERCAGQEAKHESSIGPCRKASKLITCRTVLAKLKPATTSWHLEYWPLHSTRKTLTCQNWVKWRATKGAWGIGAHYAWLKEKETILSWIYQAEKANSRLSRKTFSHNFPTLFNGEPTQLLIYWHGNVAICVLDICLIIFLQSLLLWVFIATYCKGMWKQTVCSSKNIC